MNRGDWLIAIASVFAAQLFLLLIELLRGRLERRQRHNDRRDDFQRETLLNIKDELIKMTRAAGSVRWEDLDAYQKSKDWNNLPLSEERKQKAALFQDASFTLDGLRECAFDEKLRNDVQKVQRFAKVVVFVPTNDIPPGASKDAFGEMIDAYKLALSRFGELIRKL